MKTCDKWDRVEYIKAICPHCRIIDTYFGPNKPGDIVQCKNYWCKKKFKLGEPE